jgi:hypothetical protein
MKKNNNKINNLKAKDYKPANNQPVMKGSLLEKNACRHHDHFTDVSPETDWKVAIDYAIKLGLGNKEYYKSDNKREDIFLEIFILAIIFQLDFY